MAEEQGFAQARTRLEEIVVQVRKKDTSLEQSLDLLEEGVRLANQCTELVDHSEWRSSGEPAPEAGGDGDVIADTAQPASGTSGETPADASADVQVADEPRDTNEPADGTDAASTPAEAAGVQSEADSGDEYDDIFADED